jgi:hypothetical protein
MLFISASIPTASTCEQPLYLKLLFVINHLMRRISSHHPSSLFSSKNRVAVVLY